MAIQGVDTKCYILALFVRDDGERFLLGSGHYEFKDTQMHFAANAIQNDIVEVQGNDGFLLAGQVRRPGTQSFDGYVGDGTMSKEETESYRRQFFSFFRKNFFYKVIYVFSDGTAIQRKSGFLVDDPTVEELYQMYPEYHVALNFEDVNYYSYSEDEEGQEQYAKEATIDTSSMWATGGLVWDEYGAVNQGYAWGGEMTASGTEFTVQNDLSLPAPITDTRLNGDTYQQTYSGKNLLPPVENRTITSGGISFTATDELITGSGTLTATPPNISYQVFFDQSLPAGTYTFSIPEANTYMIRISLLDSNNVWHSSNTETGIPAGQTSKTITTTYTIIGYRITLGNTTVGQEINLSIKNQFQLEAGSTATAYEPYVGGVPAPNPDYPQQIQTVTGEQTVSISDGNGNSQSYSISLGSTELCKLGDYQDYIYKSGADWYVHKEVAKVTFTGTEGWTLAATYTNNKRFVCNDIIASSASNTVLSDYFTQGVGGSDTENVAINNANRKIMLTISNSTVSNLADFRTWLGSNKPTVYYILATPTDTKITDTTLSSQLDALGSAKLMVGENNVLVSATGTNLPAELQIKYYSTVSFDGAGFVWEEGGSGGATVVEVDSITNTYPIWRVKGPAVDPQLSVINTNTTIRYTGTVTSTQTLEIDMFNKTAKLNGVSVIGNVSGDWVSLAPGTNRVIYTAENVDAQPSTIEWQEVVG